MIHVDAFVFVMILVLFAVSWSAIGAAVWGNAVKRDALEDKSWILKNTIFKDRLIAELRGLEADVRATLILMPPEAEALGAGYWKGKLQAYRDIIVRLGGNIYE